MGFDIEGFIDWWKWVLRFNPVKYTGLGIMIAGPLALFYRFFFMDSYPTELTLGIGISLFIGCLLFHFGWEYD